MVNDSIFFIHGGPGFNSEPERQILNEVLQSAGLGVYFWDEPSRQRDGKGPIPFDDNHAYSNWLKSLSECLKTRSPKVVVAASFGGIAALDLIAQKALGDDCQVVFLAPTLDLGAAFKRMMILSEQDFASDQPKIAEQIRQHRQKTSRFWDEEMQRGMQLTYQNPHLLHHYFVSDQAKQAWVKSLSKEPYQMAPSEMNAVLNDFAKKEAPKGAKEFRKLAASVYYGSRDPVFNREETNSILRKFFSAVNFKEFTNSGHFPHLEKPDEFTSLIGSLLYNV